MAHVAFCLAPFSGHVNPTLAVAAELARRGHRVGYATTAEFAPAARAAGAYVVTHETTMRIPKDGRVPRPAPGGDDLARAWRGQLRELQAVAPALLRAFGDDAPHVVVCDPMNWAARVLAARWQVPAITSVTSLISSSRWSLGPVGIVFRPDHPALPVLLAATSAALARLGTALTADRLLGIGAAEPVLASFPRAFQPGGDQFGPNVTFTGPCLGSRPGAPLDQPWPPPGDGPLVLVSLGTVVNRQPELFRVCLDALAGAGARVVAALGGLDPAELGALPPGALAYASLPLARVVRDAQVLVGHGGMTSTMEALSYGVPVAALPQLPEQRVNAARLAELGLGRCLEPGRQTGEAVREAVGALLRDAGLRPRLDWMRAEIESAPGARGAAEVIESTIRERHDVSRPA